MDTEGESLMRGLRFLFPVSLAALIVCIAAMTPRDGAKAESASAAAAVTSALDVPDGCLHGIRLQNGTATYSSSQGPFPAAAAVDGNFDPNNGWGIARFAATSFTFSETAVWETATDVSAGPLVFKMYFLHGNPGHLLGRFRFSITTDDRSTFADGLDTGGDV